ncbi:MAG: toxin glutamine deamidase domain-containing protein, partial [Granulosicoccus sp.]
MRRLTVLIAPSRLNYQCRDIRHPTSAIVSKGLSHGKVIEEIFDAKFYSVERLSGIESTMLKAGHGARGIIAGKRLNGRSHAYNVYNDHGTIKYLEGQLGVVDFKYRPGFIHFALLITHKNVNLPGESIKVLQAVSPSNASTAEIEESRTGSAQSDGILDTALGWLLGKAEVGELESSNGTGLSIGDQKIVEENLARLNRNEPRLTADEEGVIRESAEQSVAADEDPETSGIAPEVVVPAEEATSDPAAIETDKEPEVEESTGLVNLKHVDSYAPEEGSTFA